MAHHFINSWTGYQFGQRLAKVAELVDALDLGSSGVTRESSSLSFRTIFKTCPGWGAGGSRALVRMP